MGTVTLITWVRTLKGSESVDLYSKGSASVNLYSKGSASVDFYFKGSASVGVYFKGSDSVDLKVIGHCSHFRCFKIGAR